MLLLDVLAERKMEEHIAGSDCSQNSFSGKSLDLSFDAHVPAQVRALYRVLKHNGYLPAEVELRNEIQSINHLLSHISCEHERGLAFKRLQLLNTQLEAQGRGMATRPMAKYQTQLLASMGE